MDPKSPSNFHMPPTPAANALSSIPFIPFVIILFIVFLGVLIIFLRQNFQFVSSVRSSAAGGGVNSAVPLQSTEAGLDPAIIASFPVFRYAEVRRLLEERNGGDCAVCLSDFAADDDVRLLTACCHAFHPGCIDLWFVSHRTCPICRLNVEETPNEATVTVLREVVASGSGSAGHGDNYVINIEGAGELAEAK
ncbi:RING-H2 finger protein ATL28-like [Dendrobium catenatum]|uniref:RING-type E3 ubiquitin transferase n=1 Tax=Dendrobium catenatum TaxID=906689 RepID=A0A2I0W6U3_9ASPA|nr:RING-H2 finger protein ATL28-like [Dendrobium catenatum]PKU71377.1 RING-H2 finger protein ATL29 [Dendrobium catenatum]